MSDNTPNTANSHDKYRADGGFEKQPTSVDTDDRWDGSGSNLAESLEKEREEAGYDREHSLKEKLALPIIRRLSSVYRSDGSRGNTAYSRTETLALRLFGTAVREREERFAKYKELHNMARFSRDWDVQIAVGLLNIILYPIAVAIAMTIGVFATSFGLGLWTLTLIFFSYLTTLFVCYVWFLEYKARVRIQQRKREIEKLLPRAIAYMFSHAEGQMTMPEIIERIAGEQESYGAVAEEFAVVHKEVDIFESDLRSALRKARKTTPSESLETFFDELINIVDTSGELTSFLQQKTEEYQSQSEQDEQRFINRLASIGNGYTIIGVFFPIVGIIAMLFLSLLGFVGIHWLFFLVYGYIPLVSIGTILIVRTLSVSSLGEYPSLNTTYSGTSPQEIDRILERVSDDDGSKVSRDQQPVSGHTQHARSGGADIDTPVSYVDFTTDVSPHSVITSPRKIVSRIDGHPGPISKSEESGLKQLRKALRLVNYRRAINNLSQTLTNRPELTLLGSIPAACILIISMLLTGVADIGALETDPIYQTTMLMSIPLFVILVPLWWYARKLRIRDEEIRELLPNMLRKISSTTEAGTPFVEAIKTVGETDADDELSTELKRMKNEVDSFFVSIDDMLVRMANRVRNKRVARINRLLIEANTSSGNLQDILNVAARDAENSRYLDKVRQNKLEGTMGSILFAFFIFAGLAVGFQIFLVPEFAATTEFSSSIPTNELGGSNFAPQVNEELLSLALIQATVVLGVTSGFVAGQLGYNDIRTGAGWALMNLVVGTSLFILVNAGILGIF